MRFTIHCALGVLAGIVLAASVFAQGARPADVQDQSFVAADGTRVLQQSIVVPAGTAAVWNAFTTSEGFASWAAPVAAVDFRLGGSIESAYDPKGKIGAPGNIKNEIIAFVPQRMLAIRNTQAPPSTAFDTPTFQQLHTVIFMEPVTATTTLVTIVQPGFGKGEKFDGVYAFFARGNGWSLQELAKRFADAPKSPPKSP